MRRWPLLVCVLGCHHDGWHVFVPKQIDAVPLDSVYAFRVYNYTGGVEPGPARTLEARCADPGICEARAPKPGVVEVLPHAVGATTVVVDVVNAYSKRERHTLPITVVPAVAHTAFSVGGPVPTQRDLVYRAGDVDVAHCAPATDRGAASGSERADVRVFSCTPYVELDTRRFRNDEGHLLCAQVADDVVVGAAVIAQVDGTWAVASTEGTLSPDVCTARN